MLVSRDHLTKLLQSRDLGNQAEKADLSRCFVGKFELLDQLWRQAPGRKMGNYECHCIPHGRTPLDISVGNQSADRDHLVHDP